MRNEEAKAKDFQRRMMGAVKAAFPQGGDPMESTGILLKAAAACAAMCGMSADMFADAAREILHVTAADLDDVASRGVVPAPKRDERLTSLDKGVQTVTRALIERCGSIEELAKLLNVEPKVVAGMAIGAHRAGLSMTQRLAALAGLTLVELEQGVAPRGPTPATAPGGSKPAARRR